MFKLIQNTFYLLEDQYLYSLRNNIIKLYVIPWSRSLQRHLPVLGLKSYAVQMKFHSTVGVSTKAMYLKAQIGGHYWGKELERVHGIEPSYTAWKAGALPLCYTRSGSQHPIACFV